jgi:hypothetical protein
MFLLGSIILTAIFTVVVCGLYFDNFPGGLSENQSDWGDFGSYIGGTVGAAFAFGSFFALLYTVVLQKQELATAINVLEDSAKSHRMQVENHKAQKFETTFYSLLELHNQAIKELNIQDDDFDKYLKDLNNESTSNEGSNYNLDKRQECILESVELSQYFRILYQLLKYIAKNNVKNANNEFSDLSLLDRRSIDEYENEEKMYASLVRSFVPVKILPVLALNCIPSYKGLTNLKKFNSLLERYSFLEHMRLDHLSLNMSTFLILDKYSYAMGENQGITQKVKDIKSKYPQHFDEGLMEGGYLYTYASAPIF